jgi:pimeloyl-ACP methyl ester carboxylesterase
MSEPAWKHKPSWYLLAERDRIIAAETQRFMAERAGSRIASRDVDHSPASSAPQAVVEVIREAMRSI